MSDFIFAIKILGVVVIGLIVILALFNSLKKHDRAILRKRILTGLIDYILLPILSICFGTSIIACDLSVLHLIIRFDEYNSTTNLPLSG